MDRLRLHLPTAARAAGDEAPEVESVESSGEGGGSTSGEASEHDGAGHPAAEGGPPGGEPSSGPPSAEAASAPPSGEMPSNPPGAETPGGGPSEVYATESSAGGPAAPAERIGALAKGAISAKMYVWDDARVAAMVQLGNCAAIAAELRFAANLAVQLSNARKVACQAMLQGKVEVLRWIQSVDESSVRAGCTAFIDQWRAASASPDVGQGEALAIVYAAGVRPDANIATMLARDGKVDLLRIANEKGTLPKAVPGVLQAAVNRDHAELAEWLLSVGCCASGGAVQGAMAHDRPELARRIYAQLPEGAALGTPEYRMCAAAGDLGTLHRLMDCEGGRNPDAPRWSSTVDWTEVVREAIRCRKPGTAQQLLEEGCPATIAPLRRQASLVGSCDMVAWLEARYCCCKKCPVHGA